MTGQSDPFDWPQFDENTASGLCYTSGTTGNPKGVLYSHRSCVLHSFAAALPDACNISFQDNVAFISPMFHAMSWGMPYCAPAMGSKLVMPGQKVDGESLHKLFEQEQRDLRQRRADGLARLCPVFAEPPASSRPRSNAC